MWINIAWGVISDEHPTITVRLVRSDCWIGDEWRLYKQQ